MKNLIFSWLFSMVFLATASAQYANRTGYEGDNFSLEGAIELFKQSYSINDFERKLNTQDTWVNNLDLDWDGRIDYVRVEHRRQGNYHAIILSVPLGYYDVQDIAVIEIEKVSRRRAILQIVGDPDIYGEEVIVEPISHDGYSYNGDYRYDNGNSGYVNVYYWSAVQHMLGRNYRVYASPYRYHYYPTWWSPWRPCGWDIYRPRIVIYHRHYHVVHVHRVVHVHTFYKPHRVYSHNVLARTNTVRIQHGKAAVKRKPIKQNHTRYNEYVKASKDVAKQPRGAAGNNRVDKATKPQERVPASTPRTNARENMNERNQATRPETGRVTKETRKPSVDTKRSTPSRSDKARGNTSSTKRTTPAASQGTNRSSSANKSTPRSTPKASRSSSQPSRSTPKANRSSSQPSRSTPKASSSSSQKRSTPSATRSSSSRSSASRGTTNRSSKPAAKSSSSSRSSSSTKATRKTSSSSSRNKRG